MDDEYIMSYCIDVHTLDDWYNVNAKMVQENGGDQVLRYFNKSLIAALKELYPNHPWQIERFSRVPSGYWANKENQKEFMDQLAVKLSILCQVFSK
jgi:hypothetical protein